MAVALIALVVAGACSVPPSLRQIDLVGPDGLARVTLIDDVGIVADARGIFQDRRAGWAEGLTVPNSLLIEIAWSGGCDDHTTIRLEPGAGGLAVVVGTPRHPATSSCGPRGFVSHTLLIDLVRPIGEKDVEVEFEGR